MFNINLKGFGEMRQAAEELAKDQVPFATVLTVNDLGFMVRDAEMKTVAGVFDRPKPQTVRNFIYSKATRAQVYPEATLWFNQIYRDRYNEYMVPEVAGGRRKMKRSERMLGDFYVPGAGAKIDPYGNMQGGQITQILSQLQAFAEVGWTMNLNKRNANRRRPMGSRGIEYFAVLTTKHGGLKPGVYQRTTGMGPHPKGAEPHFTGKTSRALPFGAFQKGKSSGPFTSVIKARGAIPVMVFTNRPPAYQKRFPFYETAKQVIDQNVAQVFQTRMAQCIATSIFKGGWKQWGGDMWR